MKPRLIALALSSLVTLFATPGRTEPPPGHPSAGQAMEILMPQGPLQPVNLMLGGKVISSIDANQFTYIELEGSQGPYWIAAPLMAVKPGSQVQHDTGRLMHHFYSKLLQRNFPSVRFVRHVEVVSEATTN